MDETFKGSNNALQGLVASANRKAVLSREPRANSISSLASLYSRSSIPPNDSYAQNRNAVEHAERRLDDATFARLVAASQRQRRSLSDYVRLLVDEQQRKQEHAA